MYYAWHLVLQAHSCEVFDRLNFILSHSSECSKSSFISISCWPKIKTYEFTKVQCRRSVPSTAALLSFWFQVRAWHPSTLQPNTTPNHVILILWYEILSCIMRFFHYWFAIVTVGLTVAHAVEPKPARKPCEARLFSCRHRFVQCFIWPI